MASDSKQTDVASESPDPETPAEPGSDTARRRKFASSLLKAAATPVSAETSLDAFIAKANEELIDVVSAPFKPEHREGQLRRDLEAVQAKLAAAETRAARADARAADAEARAADHRSSPGWGRTIAAFLIGGAAMFAISLVLPGKERPPAPAVTSPAVTPAAPTPPVGAGPPATDDVAAHAPAVPPPAVADVVPAPPPPPAPEKVTPDKVSPDKVIPEKITKKPAGKPDGRRPAVREDPVPAPKPPEDDLYNPF